MKYLGYRIARPVLSFIMKYIYRVNIDGALPKEGCIIVSNHTSTLDPLLIISSSKDVLRFLAKKELIKPIFTLGGSIMVDRGGDTTKAVEEALKALNNGEKIVVFPEGTIGKHGLLPFKKGAVNFSKTTGKDIIPCVIKGKYRMFKKSVTFKVLEPFKIESDDLSRENERLRNIIKEELLK